MLRALVKTRIRTRLLMSLLIAKVVVVAALFPICNPVIAQERATEPSGWEFRAVPYIWFAGQSGEMGVLGRDGLPIKVEFEDVIENLDFGAMAVLEAGKGQWSVMMNAMYVNLGRDSLGTEDQSTIDASQVMLDAVGIFHPRDPGFLDLYAGIRYTYLDAQLEQEDGTRGSSGTGWVDPIIGLRLKWNVGSHWLLGVLGDVGGFGVASDFTWQIQPGVGYRFSKTWAALLVYRHLSIDYEDDDTTILYDVQTGGPALGAEISF